MAAVPVSWAARRAARRRIAGSVGIAPTGAGPADDARVGASPKAMSTGCRMVNNRVDHERGPGVCGGRVAMAPEAPSAVGSAPVAVPADTSPPLSNADRHAQRELLQVFCVAMGRPRPTRGMIQRYAARNQLNDAAKMRMAVKVVDLLRSFKQKHPAASARGYHPALEYLATIHADPHLEDAWAVMRGHGVTPDAFAYTQRLSVYTRSKPDAAMRVVAIYKELREAGIAPDAGIHRAVGTVLLRCGHYERGVAFAEASFREMGRVDPALAGECVAQAPSPATAELMVERFDLPAHHTTVAMHLLKACRRTGDAAAAERIITKLTRPAKKCHRQLLLVYQDRGDYEAVARRVGAWTAAHGGEADVGDYLMMFRAAARPYYEDVDAGAGAGHAGAHDGGREGAADGAGGRPAATSDLADRKRFAMRCYDLAMSEGKVTTVAHSTALLRLAAADGDVAMADRLREGLRECGLAETSLFRTLYTRVLQQAGVDPLAVPQRGEKLRLHREPRAFAYDS